MLEKVEYSMLIMLALLIFVPILFGFVALLIKQFRPRRFIIITGAFVQACIALVFTFMAVRFLPFSIQFDAPILEVILPILEIMMALYVIIRSVLAKKVMTFILGIVQVALTVITEIYASNIKAVNMFKVDQLSLIMTLIIALVGGLIIFYSAGYMKTFHEEHTNVKDRRNLFACLMIVFLGAMYGLVFANDLRILLFFWEVTTLASFILIGYSKEKESEHNAFTALLLNSLGGISFQCAILFLVFKTGSVELDFFVKLSASNPVLIAIPLALLALAGLIKSAQLPFSSWLLGAMVAPTPVSALLHSSTMVKAGSYLLIRLAPALMGTMTGYLVAFIGILTFIAGAFAAISKRNAKRVLAFSTISNLGLIAACAGVGTYQLVWVAVFLLLFHAVAKALLFLSVGTASVGTGSLDIEKMGGLIISMPRTGLFLTIGISAMFVAPFGMLISKWAAMEAFIKLHSIISPIMIVFIAYGSATTVFFWTKWLGVIIRMSDPLAPRGLLEKKLSLHEFIAESSLAVLVVLLCLSIPLISSYFIEPFILSNYGIPFGLDRSNAIITVLMVCMTLFVPALLLFVSKLQKKSLSSPYISGRTQKSGMVFKASMGRELTVETRSYYLESIFNEAIIMRIGMALSGLLVITMLGTVLL